MTAYTARSQTELDQLIKAGVLTPVATSAPASPDPPEDAYTALYGSRPVEPEPTDDAYALLYGAQEPAARGR